MAIHGVTARGGRHAAVFSWSLLLMLGIAQVQAGSEPPSVLAGDVCPPFYLRDEAGEVINPVEGVNASRPYSPKRTCGPCHDYEKITSGFHFTQGAGEEPPKDLVSRCAWVLSPGNYGGPW